MRLLVRAGYFIPPAGSAIIEGASKQQQLFLKTNINSFHQSHGFTGMEGL